MIAVTPLHASEAAKVLAGLERLDPTGALQASDIEAMCERDKCVRVMAPHGAAAVAVAPVGKVLWIDAVRGVGDSDMTAAVDDAVCSLARQLGMQAVAFQTKRRGLVRKCERRGYQLTGWIMRKDI